MKPVRHIHCIGIGGIGISALARFYLQKGYRVTGTNTGSSPLIETLRSEGIEIVENGAQMIDRQTEKVIYTEAIIDDHTLGLEGVRDVHQAEIKVAQAYEIPTLSYPEALAEVFHTFPMKIAVAGAHGKSTTSAMIGTILHDLHASATTITGTLVKAFEGKNVYIAPLIKGGRGDLETMNIEACEYRNAFLNYKPDIAVITNIDPDHLDFFKTEEAYAAAFETFMQQSRCVVILAEEYEKIKNNQLCPLDKGGQGGLEKLTHIPYNPKLTQYAKDQRTTASLAENRMWYDVLRCGDLKQYRFLRQKPLLNFIADFYCSELGLVIEVDGDDHDNKKDYDQYRTDELKKYGLTVLRFHNLRVMEDPVRVEKEIINWIQLNPPSVPPLSRGQDTLSTFVIVYPDHFELIGSAFNEMELGVYPFDLPDLLVPGDHIRLDAKLAYVVSQLLHLDPESSKKSLANYPGSWRRMEIIGTTKHSNLLMSDYGHHPTEITLTLAALKKAHPDKKIIVFFEPHQYSRTYELRDEFAKSFTDADATYIADIYAARDIDERRDLIDSRTLAEMVAKHSPCAYSGNLAETGKKLQEIDATEKNSLLLLLGAGNIDSLRNILESTI